jgi:nucleoside-diphosphate-sugar epimerase
MRVLVTGGTGYVGAYVVDALRSNGHDVRLLVRNPARLATTVEAIGVDLAAVEVAIGDMTDRASVEDALGDIDAVIHCAAVVAALNRSDAEATVATNVAGTRNVLDAALEAGCDPVIHTSSVAALFTKTAPVIHSDLPPAVQAASPYTRSKALAEEYARERQAAGAPVVIVYPGGVSGPAAGKAVGEVAEGFVSMLKPGLVPLRGGAFTIIDVRDLAAVIVAALTPGLGPRRFMTGGELIDMVEISRLLRAVTGRRMPVLPLPGVAFRLLGRVLDVVRTAIPIDTVFSAEAMDLLTLARPTDDTAVHEQLAISYRPTIDTVREMVRALYDSGRLTAKQVGRVAGEPGPA